MSEKQWVTEPDQELLRIDKGDMRPAITVLEMLEKTVKKHGGRNAMALKRKEPGGALPEAWKFWTYKEYYNDCIAFAKTLISLEVSMYKIVNIIGFNSPEWSIADVGCMFAGCIASGVYSTNTSEACQYILEHSKGEILICEDNKQLQKYAERSADDLKTLKAIVVWAEIPNTGMIDQLADIVPVYTWEAFMKLGQAVSDSAVTDRSTQVKPGNCASLIYTSGTTGPPKAAMLSHDNLTWTTGNLCDTLQFTCKERIVSYLPLSHVAAQLTDIYAMIYLGACCYFCQPDAMKGTLTVTMKDVLPTFFFAVPRVWEKISEKMAQAGRETTGTKAKLVKWAKGLGARHVKRKEFGGRGGFPWGYKVANSLVLSKVKIALGLDKCTACFTGAAPISTDILNYFAAIDIPIYELFGQSECSGPHTAQYKKNWKIGTCGRPLMGTTTRLDKDTGELCYAGRHIFMGYMYMPEKTAETIDDEGFLHSGDVAVLDDDNHPNIPAPSGFLSITGRIKELIITAGGENVPPILIENNMKTAMPAVSNVMVIGDQRKFLSQLVSLKVDIDLETGSPTDKLAADALHVGRQIGSTSTTYTQAKADPLWKQYVDDGTKAANKETTSNAQIVQKWEWLPMDFSEKAGDLTPTLKLKRNVVAAKNAELIDSIYT